MSSYTDYAKNTAIQRITSLKTNADALFESVDYATGNQSNAQLKESIFTYSKETLNQYDTAKGANGKYLYGNGDGKVSVDEYVAATTDITVKNEQALYKKNNWGDVSEAEKAIAEDKNRDFAKIIDANGDGYISTEEEALVNIIADSEDSEGFDGVITFEGSMKVSGMINSGTINMEEQAKRFGIDLGIPGSAPAQDSKPEPGTVPAQDSKPTTGTVTDPAPGTVPAQDYKNVTVQKWGSKATDGRKYANDCLSRIIANNYPTIKLYSEEYRKILDKILSLNKMKDSDIIYTDQVIKLPVLDD